MFGSCAGRWARHLGHVSVKWARSPDGGSEVPAKIACALISSNAVYQAVANQISISSTQRRFVRDAQEFSRPNDLLLGNSSSSDFHLLKITIKGSTRKGGLWQSTAVSRLGRRRDHSGRLRRRRRAWNRGSGRRGSKEGSMASSVMERERCSKALSRESKALDFSPSWA